MSEKYKKEGEFTGWSEDTSEQPPAYQQYRPPPGPPPQHPLSQRNGYKDDSGYNGGRRPADPYYPSSNNPYSSGSSPYPPGPSPYGGFDYTGPSQSQPPPQGYYSSPAGDSQGGSPYPGDMSQQFTGFTYTGNAPDKRDPLNPPPPSFSRQPDPQCPYPWLPEPVRIPSQDKSSLSKGFMPIFPAPQLLMAHDVQPADISRLLEDCHIMGGGNNIGQKVVANVAPMVLGVGFLPGLFVTRGIEKHMKRGRVEDIAGLFEVWDSAFFAPRRLRLTLQQSPSRKDNGYSSDSSSSSDDKCRRRHGGRRSDRRARKADRRSSRRNDGIISGGDQRIYLIISDR